jgi:hypothetical protein
MVHREPGEVHSGVHHAVVLVHVATQVPGVAVEAASRGAAAAAAAGVADQLVANHTLVSCSLGLQQVVARLLLLLPQGQEQLSQAQVQVKEQLLELRRFVGCWLQALLQLELVQHHLLKQYQLQQVRLQAPRADVLLAWQAPAWVRSTCTTVSGSAGVRYIVDLCSIC